MIDKIIEFSAKNKFIVIFFTIAAIVGAVYGIRNIPLDAIPDLSDTQVIIYSQWDRSPDIIEDQVTYPIVTAMLGAPGVKAIRGFSDFGFSYVYVIFRGRHGHLLGPQPDDGVPQQNHRPAAAGRPDGDWAGCHGRWAGSINMPWWTRPATTVSPICAAFRTGTCATGSKACRVSRKWPPSAAFRSSTR